MDGLFLYRQTVRMNQKEKEIRHERTGKVPNDAGDDTRRVPVGRPSVLFDEWSASTYGTDMYM